MGAALTFSTSSHRTILSSKAKEYAEGQINKIDTFTEL